jgi:benzoyl-CoA reductase/2-hydroxyglutaryl-CoA dehydratase subunit BcrC/BadD/HgdB
MDNYRKRLHEENRRAEETEKKRQERLEERKKALEEWHKHKVGDSPVKNGVLNYLEVRPRKKRLSKLDHQQAEAVPEPLTVENSVVDDDPNEITVDSFARETKNISQLSLTLAVRSPRTKAK